VNASFWKDKKVFVTGHTGFKGGWLTLWLSQMGAEVAGYAKEPPTEPSFFDAVELEKKISQSIIADIRDYDYLKKSIRQFQPEIVFHLAAQPLVKESYVRPLETFETNIQGTAHVLEALRDLPSIRSAVMITTDKCYENQEKDYAYKETDPLGGHDPYSSSKAGSELVVQSYQRSFFIPEGKVGVASTRAGNVIGGGDWAKYRVIPDLVRAMVSSEPVYIRNPSAIRPWQHVLEPLAGYLILAENLYVNPMKFSKAYNFGPNEKDCQPVGLLAEKMKSFFGDKLQLEIDRGNHPHEAHFLKLDSERAKQELSWEPSWALSQALQKTYEWYDFWMKNPSPEALTQYTLKQIQEYESCRLH